MIDSGHGLALGPLNSYHCDIIRNWRNDYRIWRRCRQNDLISDFDQSRWFESQSKDPTIKMYSILVDNQIVGVCGLTSIDLYNRRAEFSIYIAAEYHGNKHGEKALKTLLDHAFLNLNLNTVWGETVGENPAMFMFEKVGFEKEGLRREFYFKDGLYEDSHLYSIQRNRWQDVRTSWGE